MHKCAQLLRFSISLKFKNLQWMLVSVRLYLVHLDSAWLNCFKTSARNSVQHKKSRPWSLPSLGTTQQNICSNVLNYYASRLAGTSKALKCLSQKGCYLYTWINNWFMRQRASSRYEARGKFGEHERCVRVARGVAESSSSFLSALQTSQVLHISMNAQLTHESIVL